MMLPKAAIRMIKKYNAEWFRNEDDIAVFHSKANPARIKKALHSLLYIHLKMVTDQVIPRIKKDRILKFLHMTREKTISSNGRTLPNKYQN
ncbi:hypothetical protein [Bacillus sp. OV322]|uniref:hypothetical protein n=1 Tax=Bacillus sp. OV322 TaxID=1882764 RepID=UPI000B869AB1|nr:hypothetical protein [Bacillus sp. OV322]